MSTDIAFPQPTKINRDSEGKFRPAGLKVHLKSLESGLMWVREGTHWATIRAAGLAIGGSDTGGPALTELCPQ